MEDAQGLPRALQGPAVAELRDTQSGTEAAIGSRLKSELRGDSSNVDQDERVIPGSVNVAQARHSRSTGANAMESELGKRVPLGYTSDSLQGDVLYPWQSGLGTVLSLDATPDSLNVDTPRTSLTSGADQDSVVEDSQWACSVGASRSDFQPGHVSPSSDWAEPDVSSPIQRGQLVLHPGRAAESSPIVRSLAGSAGVVGPTPRLTTESKPNEIPADLESVDSEYSQETEWIPSVPGSLGYPDHLLQHYKYGRQRRVERGAGAQEGVGASSATSANDEPWGGGTVVQRDGSVGSFVTGSGSPLPSDAGDARGGGLGQGQPIAEGEKVGEKFEAETKDTQLEEGQENLDQAQGGPEVHHSVSGEASQDFRSTEWMRTMVVMRHAERADDTTGAAATPMRAADGTAAAAMPSNPTDDTAAVAGAAATPNSDAQGTPAAAMPSNRTDDAAAAAAVTATPSSRTDGTVATASVASTARSGAESRSHEAKSEARPLPTGTEGAAAFNASSSPPRVWDPPITARGQEAAFAVGSQLAKCELASPSPWAPQRVLRAPPRPVLAPTRVFSSPFLRCVQTAAEVARALANQFGPGVADGDDTLETQSTVKVHLHPGLGSFMDLQWVRPAPPCLAIPRGQLDGGADVDMPWVLPYAELEAILPAGMLEPLTPDMANDKLAAWPETEKEATGRVLRTIQSIWSRFPNEHITCITHGEVVAAVVQHLIGVEVYAVEYCGYATLQHPAGTPVPGQTGKDLTDLEGSDEALAGCKENDRRGSKEPLESWKLNTRNGETGVLWLTSN